MAKTAKKQTQSAEGPRGQGRQEMPALSRRGRQSGQRSGSDENGRRHGRLNQTNHVRLAHGLGLFGIGLGLAEVLAPRRVAKIVGVGGNHTGLIRLFGLREIASGIGIFAQGRRPSAAMWSRVAGDALDVATLGAAALSPKSRKGLVAFATANVLAVTALDLICAQGLSSSMSAEGSKVRRSLIINRSPEEVYQFWHNLENLPRFMSELESVRVTADKRSHWVVKGPGETRVEWDAEIIEDRPNELISWRSLEGADLANRGSVSFQQAPGNRGTIVNVEIHYSTPGGVLGEWVAWLSGKEPGQQAQEALRCLKQILETGEVLVSDGTIWENGLLTQRPAQPPSSRELGQSRTAGAR